MALKCGDTTARDLGRITLDPIAHIDPFMSIVLPLLLYVSNAGFLFGGAKPVPVNFYNLRRPYRDMALVALAGPVSNFLIAVFLAFVWKGAVVELELVSSKMVAAEILRNGIVLNLILAAFNLLPIPPLDGSRIMAWLLPEGLRASYHRMESFGLFLVVGYVFFLGGNRVIMSMAYTLLGWVDWIISFGGAW